MTRRFIYFTALVTCFRRLRGRCSSIDVSGKVDELQFFFNENNSSCSTLMADGSSPGMGTCLNGVASDSGNHSSGTL